MNEARRFGEDPLPQTVAAASAMRRVIDLMVSMEHEHPVVDEMIARFADWEATLAEQALDDDKAVTAYAYARTGYHRGLDQLRRNGWKGFGPVPFSHEPNQGFLRCVAALARAANDIGETDEYQRCLDLLDDCDPTARRELGLA